jgi:hypothetical protein
MLPTQCRTVFLFVSLSIVFTLGGFAPRGLPQQRQQPDQLEGIPVPKPSPKRAFFSIEDCRQCHLTPPPGAAPVICRCTEMAIWKKEDKHGLAFNVLDGDRGRAIGRLMSIKGKVTDERRCIVCHSAYIENAEEKHSFKPEEGVSCVVCHGAALEWVEIHGGLRKNQWRKLTRQDKQTYFGMTDLWDLNTRSQVCASCHVGNAEQGKFVTHEMYAAGHPPLPGIEVATFCQAMPPHWESLRAKEERLRRLQVANLAQLLPYKPAEAAFEQTRAVLVGGVATFQTAMQLLAREAQTSADAKDPNGGALDLANFDCYACHHELKSPSNRPRLSGLPGRPGMRQWPTALVTVALKHAAREESEFRAKLADLQRAFDVQPFGDCVRIAAAAKALVEWSSSLAAEVDKRPVDEAAALRMLRQLAELGTQPVDYDTARQIAWAFRVIRADWDPAGAKTPRINQFLESLDRDLKLQLPSRQSGDISHDPSAMLTTRSAFDPASFSQGCRQIAQELPVP